MTRPLWAVPSPLLSDGDVTSFGVLTGGGSVGGQLPVR